MHLKGKHGSRGKGCSYQSVIHEKEEREAYKDSLYYRGKKDTPLTRNSQDHEEEGKVD